MRRFSLPKSEEQERRFFYALMLRSRGEKRLVFQGFADTGFKGGKGFIPFPSKSAFNCVTETTAKE